MMEKELAQEGLISKRDFSAKKFFLQWEWILVLILIAVNVMNYILSPDTYFSGISTQMSDMLGKSFIVFPMVFIILLGDIDISVASTAALSAVIMGVFYNLGLPMPLALLLCVGIGTLCGYVNGLLLTRFKELSAVIVTLATMTLYRGIAYIILQDQAAGGFPTWFQFFSYGDIFGIPFILICFAGCAVLFSLLLHKTIFGRRLYAMGNNITASRFSGVKADQMKVIVFTLAGLMSGVYAIFLTSTMMSTRPNVANGVELDVIAMAVLGGVSTAGGKGSMIGPIIAVFVIGLLKYGLGMINASAQLIIIIVGLLLIVAVSIPSIQEMYRVSKSKRLN